MNNGQQPTGGNKAPAPDERERYLAALVEIQTLLLSERYGEANLKSILQILGKAAGASRVYLHANSRREDGQWCSARLAQWLAPGEPLTAGEPDGMDIAYADGFPHWFSILSRGMYINETAADFTSPEREFLRSKGTLAVLVLPVFISSTFYGFIGFDNCQTDRRWAPSEIAFLQIGAACISWAQQRQWDEEALRRSQSSLLLVQDQLPAILWTTNRDLKITSIRGSGRLGLTTDELGRFFSLFQLRGENTSMLEMHARALGGQQVSFELQREDRGFQARLEPFSNAAGAVVGVLGLALDITEQKRVESDLRKSEEGLRSLNEITLNAQLNFKEKIQALLVIGTRQYEMEVGTLVKVGEAKCQVSEQYSAVTNPASGIRLDVNPQSYQDFQKTDTPLALAEISATSWISHPFFRDSGIGCFLEAPVRVAGKAFGILIFSSTNPRRQPFSSSEIEFLSLMAQWIGAELEREQYLVQLQAYAEENVRKSADLAAARDQALEASRLKSEFLATMSHEIRTPMNALMGMTELLQGTALNPEQGEYADVIKNSSQDLLALINDILDLSKIEAGKLAPEVIEFELEPVVENTTALFAARASLKKIGFMIYVAPELPPAFMGDPVRLRQILSNLVSNAIKFTEHGEVMVRVAPASRVSRVPPGGGLGKGDGGIEKSHENDASISVRFEVQDSGIGLSEVARRRLFEPFTQADGSTSRKYGGTGLGLAISKRLVALLGGEIGVESVEGIGSTFWFTIPFIKTGTRAQAAASAVPGAFSLAGAHVLIADGSPSQREILHRYCSYWGMRCSEAAAFPEALARVQSALQIGDPFQLAILDASLFSVEGPSIDQALDRLSGFKLENLIYIIPYDQRRQEVELAGPARVLVLPRPVKRALLYEKCLESLYGSPSDEKTTISEDAGPGMSEAASPDGAPIAVELKSQKLVLVAEDNPSNQALVAAQLKKLGYGSEICADGKGAVQAALHHPEQLAVVLMDTQMPEMDGLEATRIIRQAEALSQAHVPIIGLTASALQEDLEACLAAGMDAALTKPVTLDQLCSAIERWRVEGERAGATGSEAAGQESAPPLDRTILDEIRSLQGEDAPNLLAELVDAYLVNSRQLIERIHRALAGQDLPDLRKAVHSLKGSSGNLGALKLGELCSEIQGHVEKGDLDAVQAGLPAILAEHERVIAALAEERKACA